MTADRHLCYDLASAALLARPTAPPRLVAARRALRNVAVQTVGVDRIGRWEQAMREMSIDAASQLSLRSYGPDADPHAHDDFDQIVLPRRGVLEMEIDGRGGRVQAGQAALVRCGTRHAFAARGDNLFVVANIGAALIAPFEGLRERAFLPVSAPVRGLLDYIAGDAAREVEDAVAALWTPLLLRGLAAARPVVDPRLVRAAALIERDFARPLAVRDLAVEAGMSQSRFFAGFAAAFGRTPRAYLADTRLRAAQRLLSETALSIADIALRTGHADQSALTRAMRARLGTTPGAWRRRG